MGRRSDMPSRALARGVIRLCDGNITRAAKVLKIDRGTLYDWGMGGPRKQPTYMGNPALRLAFEADEKIEAIARERGVTKSRIVAEALTMAFGLSLPRDEPRKRLVVGFGDEVREAFEMYRKRYGSRASRMMRRVLESL